MAEPTGRSFEKGNGQPTVSPKDERTMADMVPRLPDEEELEIIGNMTRMLTEVCNSEIVPERGGTPTRNVALIEATMTGSSVFRESNGSDWHFDVVAPVFLKRHAGTPEAAALRKIIDRANHILGKDR